MHTFPLVVVLLALAGAPLAYASQPAQTLREVRGLQPGMTVLDRRGQRIGVIVRTDQTRSGRPAILVQASGARYTIGISKLHRARRGERVVVELSPATLRTRAILNS